MSKLLKDSVLYAGGAMLIRSLGIILIPLYTKHFSLAEYGALAILNIFIQLFSTVFVFGVNSAATRFYFREDQNADTRQSMYGTAFLLLAVLPAIAGLIVMPGMILLATNVYGLPFFPLFFIAILIGVFKPLEKLATGLMRVQKRAVHYVLFYVTMFLVQFIAIYFFVAYRRLGLAGQLYGQLAAAATFFVIAIVLLRRQIQLEFDRSMASRLLQYGLPLLPYFLFVWFDVAAPRILLERLGSLDDVGLFALASQFSGMLLLVGNACDNALIPHYYELAGSQEAGEKIGKLATKFVGIAAIVSLGVYMFADDFIRAFANEKFHGAISLVSYLVLASFLRLAYRLVHWNLMSTERTQTVSLLRGIGFATLTGFILLWVGVCGFGVWGIIAAMISSEAILLATGVFVSQKCFRVHYDFAKLATILCIVIASGITLELVQPKLGSVTGFLGGVVILAAASFVILWFIEVRISLFSLAFLRVRCSMTLCKDKYAELYDVLVCPHDGVALKTHLLTEKHNGIHDQGCLMCEKCHQLWTIVEGIPRFVNEGNVDLDLDVSALEALRGKFTELPDDIITANQRRLQMWQARGGGVWERDEMEFWEKYYGQKLENGEREWAVTYNRLLPRQRHILSQLPQDLKRVLEIGCGTSGTLWADQRFIANKTYYGTDLSFNALKLARTRMPGHYVLCDVNAMPFRKGAVDAILGFGILHHLPNHEQAIETFSKTLDTGGWLGFTEKLKTSDTLQKSRLVTFAKRVVFQPDREHGEQEFVDGNNLIRLLDQICPGQYKVHYDYSVVRDVLVKITLDKLRLNRVFLASAIIFMDNLAVKVLAPVSDLFQPKNITFVAQKQ